MDLIESTDRPLSPRHPWETARARFFLRVLRDAGLLRSDLSMLDVGAGDAWFASRLAEAAGGTAVTCWDTGYETHPPPADVHPALRFVSTPEPRARFDLALFLDVLEHVEDDGAFLGAIVRDRLALEARVLVSVPAWPALFSAHDRALRHRRRYRPAAARAVLEAAGLRIERSGGLFHSLLIPRAARKALEGLRPDTAAPTLAGGWRHSPVLTSIVSAVLRSDGAISLLSSSASIELPGLSWWALCRRSS